MYSGGVNFLLPGPHDSSCTTLDDGVLNAYPPTPAIPVPCPIPCPDAVFTQAIAIPFTTVVSQVAIVGANARRATLLIQNNSAIGAARDVLPNLYVAYDGPVTTPLQQNLTILPGSGIVLDRKVRLIAIYIRWAPFTN